MVKVFEVKQEVKDGELINEIYKINVLSSKAIRTLQKLDGVRLEEVRCMTILADRSRALLEKLYNLIWWESDFRMGMTFFEAYRREILESGRRRRKRIKNKQSELEQGNVMSSWHDMAYVAKETGNILANRDLSREKLINISNIIWEITGKFEDIKEEINREIKKD